MKKNALILLMLMFSGACAFSDCVRIPMGSKDLAWYTDLPNEGDTLFYKGSDNSVDTFIVTNKYREYSQCNKMAFDNQYEKIGFSAEMRNKKIHNNSDINFELRFDKKSQENPAEDCNKYLAVFDLYIEGETSLDKFKLDTISSQSLKKKIPTYLIEASPLTNRRDGPNHVAVNSFNWNSKYGLVRYVTEEGIIYEYWKKK